MISMLYPWLKTLHILSFTAWMAGLFYLPRLLVYHAERGADAGTAATLQIMEEKLYRLIMTPAMISTYLFGIALLAVPGIVDWGTDLWIYPKIACAIGLAGFQGWLKARMRDFAQGRNRVSGRRYRMMNEVPTLALIVIVIMVIVRPI